MQEYLFASEIFNPKVLYFISNRKHDNKKLNWTQKLNSFFFNPDSCG